MAKIDLHIITTGGTIDKVYFDSLSEFQVGETAVDPLLREANITLDYKLTSLMKKDSLDLTDQDRAAIKEAVEASPAKSIIVTHGTDTMIKSACLIDQADDKSVIFTGAMQPASLRSTDAVFNIGFAVAAACIAAPGVYVAMNGRLFDPRTTVKDRQANRFVST